MRDRTSDLFRIERDYLGEMRVPKDAYYGVQTARAIENFPISGQKSHPALTSAIVCIKKAAAIVNMELGCIESRVGNMVVRACDRLLGGEFQEQFLVDVYQAGAGTSHHMNVNEVIANVAIEMMGGQKGDYSTIHPNDHVNYGQSTNDVYPTGMRIAALQLTTKLVENLNALTETFEEKAKSFHLLLKSGRTHLQDAVPVTVGQEFSGYTEALAKAARRIVHAGESLKELGIGGSAVGTGINTHPKYAGKIVEKLREVTQLDLTGAKNRFEAMQSNAPFVGLSGAIRELAVELVRIANDLRLMNSGPNTGLAEINLPAVQPGSSIMPGKVNPVIPEMLNMVCFSVLGNDVSVSFAAQAGQFELNVMMPLILYKLLDSIVILSNAIKVFREKCVYGLTVNVNKCEDYALNSLGIVTVLNPIIGYAKAAKVVKDAMQAHKSVKEIIREQGILSAEQLDEVLSPIKMTGSNTGGL
jgi:fumarate hydratase class II/aspartate ammonia-lyase